MMIPIFKENRIFTEKSGQTEIEVMLSTKCNLSCEFCKVTKEYDYSYSTEDEKYYIETIGEIIKESDKEKVSVTLYGGELFSDNVSDEVFESYERILKSIRDSGKNVAIVLMTNLITKKLERLINLAERYSCEIHPSFDFKYRFRTERARTLYMNNLRRLKETEIRVVVPINIIRPNVECVVRFDTSFTEIYEMFPVFFNEYLETHHIKGLRLTEREISDFLRFLRKNYPRVQNIVELENPDSTSGTCSQSYLIYDKCVVQCCERQKRSTHFLHKKKCLSCRYFSRCNLACPNAYSDSEDCFIRIYLDEGEFSND